LKKPLGCAVFIGGGGGGGGGGGAEEKESNHTHTRKLLNRKTAMKPGSHKGSRCFELFFCCCLVTMSNIGP
jgi:hypothetical protein